MASILQLLSLRKGETMEENTIRCTGCGETWDAETIGFVEALESLLASDFQECIACQGEKDEGESPDAA